MQTDKKAIRDVLSRQVAEVLPDRKGLSKLMAEKKIRLYLGVDPTSPNLHLGHAGVLRKLREFQNLGHEVALIFGTFTAQIGDPSGRDKQREPLSPEKIQENMKTYQTQAGHILDMRRTKILYNGDWLGKLTFTEVLKLASYFTTSQMLERDMFQKRIEQGSEIWLHELLYPLMQGYDSVAADVDLEIGGTDQTFNMLVGRRLQKLYRNKEKYVLSVPLLMGLDGRKMSKSYGNAVNLTDSAHDMYGKLMSLRDEHILPYFEAATDLSRQEVRKIERRMNKETVSPRDAKALLAKTITALYHGDKESQEAEHAFERVFREKQEPERMPIWRATQTSSSLGDLLVAAGLASSKSDARRLAEQGGVKINGHIQKDSSTQIQLAQDLVIQVGKRRFIRVKV
ncbi:MAG: tyrosine--tRNA ligase [Candidatus Wildermuthbacteria bacterium RIFCSPHIGHO2_12_FULL_45_9]|uniref:Tyrosine--tRNA ligase n=1 Tax=Candidatus Wildermuthbacteria bacterium RIFCSPHIGHO2_02_FULL_45_25 TaxID=1802450 RepID=A0A1G2R0E4_9BACT|nr:MAG: tyrosine--tRNA ligase [Candidatus Wildermuthbacteria bacterium RIFCSPHIGHO2_01_FULL_45_20]OHA66364.1 MAG: tyrosine--tRNA ligase [Candidatus Wildermuthbacteria bacterium RIFCSPHIGHO2_02_FULL_45_25]OHA72002.1 MAG: tyrosine--tRNA ligase [Candidatus Wildermuthbacteria bacterium RIFCSPHIGHO2_12_FULL_45_9]